MQSHAQALQNSQQAVSIETITASINIALDRAKDGKDNVLRNVMASHMENMPRDRTESTTRMRRHEVVAVVQHFILAFTDALPEARLAILFLANADWNFPAAVAAYGATVQKQRVAEARSEEQYSTRLYGEARAAVRTGFNLNHEPSQTPYRHWETLPGWEDIINGGHTDENPRRMTLPTARFIDMGDQRPKALEAVSHLALTDPNLERVVSDHRGSLNDDDEDESNDDEDSSPTSGLSKGQSKALSQKRKVDHCLLKARLNEGIDRTNAIKGHQDISKVTIDILLPNGRSTSYWYSRSYVMDWNNGAEVAALNKWRNQTLRRNLGPLRGGRAKFEAVESDWLVEYFEKFAKKNAFLDRNEIDWSKLRWREIETEYNDRWEGRMLPGLTQPRQHRTKKALQGHSQRLKRITDLTRFTTGKDVAKPKGEKRKDGDRVQEDGEKDEDEREGKEKKRREE